MGPWTCPTPHGARPCPPASCLCLCVHPCLPTCHEGGKRSHQALAQLQPGPTSKSQPHQPPAASSPFLSCHHHSIPTLCSDPADNSPCSDPQGAFPSGVFDPWLLPPQGSSCRTVQSGIHRTLGPPHREGHVVKCLKNTVNSVAPAA